MLGAINHVATAHQGMATGKFLKKELKRTELFGKTLVILGCGRIGTEVAKRARAFGMEVLGYDILPLQSEYMTVYQNLETVIPRGDYFSLHLPATPETRGLVNRDLLARMKHGVYMSNTGRAATVVEEDVAEALRSGQLAGYATDVWNSDPPAASPLLEAPNTLLSPHLGASTRENLLRIGEIVVQLLEKYRQGELHQN
jgi:D-3-phosphoglycerate dehydrogenase